MPEIPRTWGLAAFLRSKLIPDAPKDYLPAHVTTTDPARVDEWRQAGLAPVRVCACGCGTVIEDRDPRAKTVDAQHRAVAWKAVSGYGRPDPTADIGSGPAPSEPPRQVRANAKPKRRRTTKSLTVAPDVHEVARGAAGANGMTLRAWVEDALLRAGGVRVRTDDR